MKPSYRSCRPCGRVGRWEANRRPCPSAVETLGTPSLAACTCGPATRCFWLEAHKGAETFQAFLQCLHRHYRAWPLALLLDANSCHTARGSQALGQALGLQFLWSPTRSPHLNPLEHLWRHAKDAVCAHPQYPSLEEQVDRFIHYLQRLSPAQRLQQAGVFSGNFWLQKL